ncbi:DUF6907 domain-containing protein [Streptomyces griseoaurantiacus]|uniref:DUF6907 domain-containing protein n=1 Tax=Streptomyces griseoaurantiacus TaxID=68213 RepID=UPI00379B8124
MQKSAMSIPSIEVRPGYRLVPARVGRSDSEGTIVYVECPNWCVTDHVAYQAVFLEDVSHQGERHSVAFTPSQGERVPVEVYLSEWPALAEEEGRTYLAVDVDCEVASYGRTAALAMADQLVAFAADVRRLANTLPDDRPVLSQADEAPRRVREGRSA